MTPKQMTRIDEIADDIFMDWCENNPKGSATGSIAKAILTALRDPMLNPTCSDAREQEMGCYRAVAAENALKAAKNEALEQAAKVCDEWSKRNDDVGGYCATAIRAIKISETPK